MSLSHYQHSQHRRIEASLRRCQRPAAGQVRVPRRRPVLAIPANEHSGYASGMLGPILVLGAGSGLLFVPLNLAGLHRVRDKQSGIAPSLLNAGQQVGSSIGLAVPGAVAWTVMANSVHAQAAHASAANTQPGGPAPPPSAFAMIYHHALATGFPRPVAAGIILFALVITIAAVWVPRAGLTGSTNPAAIRPDR